MVPIVPISVAITWQRSKINKCTNQPRIEWKEMETTHHELIIMATNDYINFAFLQERY